MISVMMKTDLVLENIVSSATLRRNDSGPTVKDVCILLSEYAAWQLGSGSTCIRLERNIKRMASAFGCTAVMTILPRHIHLTVYHTGSSDSYTYICSTNSVPINFEINTRLSELSWAIADRKVDFDAAKSQFDRIIRTPTADKWFVLFVVSLANAAFCRIFSGDWYAVSVVFLSTLAGYYLKQFLCEHKVDLRITFILCAFVSSVIAAATSLFGFGSTPDIAVGTSVLYLIPGIPFLNSFSDMLAGHYICFFCRFTHALILTCSLSIGLYCSLVMMGTNIL